MPPKVGRHTKTSYSNSRANASYAECGVPAFDGLLSSGVSNAVLIMAHTTPIFLSSSILEGVCMPPKSSGLGSDESAIQITILRPRYVTSDHAFAEAKAVETKS